MRKTAKDLQLQVSSIEYVTGIPLDLAYYCGAWRVIDTDGKEIISSRSIPSLYTQLKAVILFLEITDIKL